MAPVDTSQILDDVRDGLVTAYPNDVFVIPDWVPLDEAENYRLSLVTLLGRSWVMRPIEANPDGGSVLLVTTLGAHFRAAMNPQRYTSAKAIEFVDGKVETRQVTS